MNRVIHAGSRLGLSRTSLSISQYFHVLNRAETGVLFKSLEQIFSEIFNLDVHSRSVRRRFTLVTTNQDDAQGTAQLENTGHNNSSGDMLDGKKVDKSSYQSNMERILTSRNKKNMRAQGVASLENSPVKGPEGQSTKAFNNALNDFMMSDSVIDNNGNFALRAQEMLQSPHETKGDSGKKLLADF